jgi:hypothetical protein
MKIGDTVILRKNLIIRGGGGSDLNIANIFKYIDQAIVIQEISRNLYYECPSIIVGNYNLPQTWFEPYKKTSHILLNGILNN